MTANPILQFLNLFRRTALLHESQEQSDAQLLHRCRQVGSFPGVGSKQTSVGIPLARLSSKPVPALSIVRIQLGLPVGHLGLAMFEPQLGDHFPAERNLAVPAHADEPGAGVVFGRCAASAHDAHAFA